MESVIKGAKQTAEHWLHGMRGINMFLVNGCPADAIIDLQKSADAQYCPVIVGYLLAICLERAHHYNEAKIAYEALYEQFKKDNPAFWGGSAVFYSDVLLLIEDRIKFVTKQLPKVLVASS